MRYLQHAFFAALLSTLAVTTGVLAAPLSSARNESKEFKAALHALKVDDRATAYRLFTQLWLTSPSFDVAVLLGQTEMLMEKYRDAAEHFSLAVRDMPSSEPAKAQEGVRTAFAKAKAKVGALKITVDESDAEVTIDAKLISKSSLELDAYVEPGTHVVRALHATLGAVEQTCEIKAGEQQSVDLKLSKPTSNAQSTQPAQLPFTSAHLDQPAPVKATEPPKPPPEPPAREHGRGPEARTIILISGVAITVLAAGTATYFGLKSHSLGTDAGSMGKQVESSYGKNGCATPMGATSSLCSDFRAKRNDQHDTGRAANISFAVAGVAAVATGLTYVLWPRSKTPTSAFVVAPVAAPNAGGLMLQGNF